MSPLESIHVLLPLTMGMCIYIGMLHLWLFRRSERQGHRDSAHGWVAGWCVFALVFQAGRYAQLGASVPEDAVVATRIYLAMGPMLGYCLTGFVADLSGGTFRGRRQAAAWLVAHLLLSYVILGTDLIIDGTTGTRAGPFGRLFISVEPRRTVLVFGAYAIGAVVWAGQRLARTDSMPRADQRVLLGALGAYGVLILQSVASAVRWLEMPPLSELGPFVLAIGCNVVLVRRHRDHEDRLSALVDERTAETRLVEQRLRESRKLESVGRLAAGIAHEINNPMAYVRSNLGMLRGEWQSIADDLAKASAEAPCDRIADCEALIDDSLEGVDRTIAIVRDMRSLTLGGGEPPQRSELRRIVESALRVASTHREADVALEATLAEEVFVEGSAGQLQQVVVNLVVNALQAVGQAGRVQVELRGDGEHARLQIRDDGPGMSEAVQECLFEPFFTTKPAGRGTGLGLYVSYQIVRAHGGEIAVSTGPAGSSFEVQLPRAR